MRSVELTAARVGLAAVVRLRAASAEFTSFCLCHSGTSVPMKLAYRRVLLYHPGWMLDEVVVASSHRDKLFGLHLPGVRAILLRTSSMHTFTMRDPIRVTQIGDSGLVGTSSVVPPRRLRTLPRAVWILETSPDIDGPTSGIVLQVLPSGSDVRNTHTVRHSDRKPI